PYEFKVGATLGRERKRDFVDNPNGLFSAQAAPKPPPAMYSVVEGLKVGEKRRVIVPPEAGYGKRGQNEIPKDDLFVELMKNQLSMPIVSCFQNAGFADPNTSFELNLELLQVTRPEVK
nr:peptidyl-prolyl cis-trans isomerase FKBP18, chloroplastic [Tanacetum cinerariifolium]